MLNQTFTWQMIHKWGWDPYCNSPKAIVHQKKKKICCSKLHFISKIVASNPLGGENVHMLLLPTNIIDAFHLSFYLLKLLKYLVAFLRAFEI